MADTELEKTGTSGQDGTNPGPAKSLRKRWIVLGVALLIVALAGGAATFLLRHDEEKTEPLPTLTTNAKTAPTNVPKAEVKYIQMSEQDLLNKVNYLIASKQYDEAQKLVEAQSDLSTSKVKQGLLISVLTAAGKQDEALRASEKLAGQASLSPGEYRTLGEQYAQTGDKAKATEYYNKAIDAYTKTKMGNWQAEVQRIEAAIKELQ